MAKWIILLSLLIGGFGLWYGFQHLEKSAPTTSTPTSNTVTLIHAFKDGVHRFSGVLALPHSCYAVDTNASLRGANPSILTLIVTAKDQMLDQKICLQIPTSYPFEIVTDAPKDVQTVLRVNDIKIPVTLIEVEWQNPRGTILNLENRPR
jgi:hypothetical protein